MPLTGKVALVTGAGTGIGRGALSDTEGEVRATGEAIRTAGDGEAIPLVADVGEAEQMRVAIAASWTRMGVSTSPLQTPGSTASNQKAAGRIADSLAVGPLRFRQLFDGGGLLVPEVMEKNVAQFGAVTPPKSIEDRLVFAHRFTPTIALTSEVSRVTDSTDSRGVRLVCRRQGAVAGRLDDPPVDRLIGVEIAMHVAAQVVRVHLVMQALDLADLVIGNDLARQTAGERLQSGDELEELLDIVRVEGVDAGAAVGQEIDDAFRGEHLERLPQRRARHPEELAELPFGNAGAVGKVTFDDVVA